MADMIEAQVNGLETSNLKAIDDIDQTKMWNTDIGTRLGKRLAYLLRYGAAQEGLDVSASGFVDFTRLMQVPMMRYYEPKEVLHHIQYAVSDSGRHRFERKDDHYQVLVRALYGRRMERSTMHQGTGVKRLMEVCMDYVSENLDSFDLHYFPDEFLVNSMIHKLRRSKRLNNRSLRSLLCPTIEHLDLGFVYLTENTLRLVATRCPHLRVLNLRECGYIVTDHAISNLSKKLPHLETVNLACCQHLTDKALRVLSKNCKRLSQLNLTNIPQLTQEGILFMLSSLDKLIHLDIYDNGNISDEGREILSEYANARKMTIVLKGLQLQPQSNDSESTALPLASAGKLW